MSIKHLLEDLFAMTVHGIKPGLDRMIVLLDGIDHPEERYHIIHVAGTNGKGSTCALLASVLQHAGYRVGLYTSPHIHTFNERIRINGAMIDDDALARIAQPLMRAAGDIGGTFFEVTTAVAFQHFMEQRVDIAIIETGLGGRLDATNVVTPLVSVITSIGIDHTEYLGTTLELIALEKAGIMKPDIPVVVGDAHQELRSVFSTHAATLNAPLTFALDAVRVDIDAIHPDLSMSVSVIDDDFLRYYEVGLCGAHQANNVALVLATIPFLRQIYFIDEEHIRDGLRSVCTTTGFSGRVQRWSADPLVIIDVGHNPDGIATLAQTLRDSKYPDNMWNVVFGVMSDKDAHGMLTALLPLSTHLHACAPRIARAALAQSIAATAFDVGHRNVSTHASVADACAAAIAAGPTVICGSFHVADEATTFLQR